MRVPLLGPVEVDSGRGRPGPGDRVVLAELAVRRGQPVSPDGIADALWPKGRPASWAVVQGCVSRLRARFGVAAWNMAFSQDGARLLAPGLDGWVGVYDTSTWARLGAVASEPTLDVAEGFFRPDGGAALVNGRFGAVEWTLDQDHLATAACELAGRNLSRDQPATHLADQPYRRPCPQFPAGE